MPDSAASALAAVEALIPAALTSELQQHTGPVVVIPSDGTPLTGYVAAMLPLCLERAGWPPPRVHSGSRLEVPPGTALPERLPGRVASALAGEGSALLVGAGLAEGAQQGVLRAAVYSLPGGQRVARVQVEFTVPSSHTFLVSGEAPRWPREDAEWRALLGRLFGPPTEQKREFPVRLALAEGDYLFRRGFWQQSVERLLPLTERGPTGRFMRLVMALQLAGEAEKAAELLESAIKGHPDSGPLYGLKAWFVLRRGSAKDGVLLLDQARLYDVRREGYYRYARALIALEQEDRERAEEALLKASELLPAEPFAQLKAARFYWEAARLDEAVRFYRRAVRADEASAAIWAELGTALDATGDVAGAKDAFRHALSIDPFLSDVSRHLSSLLEREGDWSGALQVLRRAADANPGQPDVQAAYGDAAAHRWLIDEAKKAFEAALACEPGFLYARVRLAEMYAAERDYEAAEQKLREVLKARADHAPAVVALGRILIAQGRTQDAIAELSSAGAESDHEVSRKLALSLAYLQSGEHAKAVENAQIAVGIGPGPRSYAMLARAFILSGELEKARMAAEKALEAGSRSAAAHLAVARVLRAAGQSEKALQHCQEAIRVDPFLVEALSLSGELHLEAGDFQGAADAWGRALALDRRDAELHWKRAELLRQHLGDMDGAISHYVRHVELGGVRAERAAEWVRTLRKAAG